MDIAALREAIKENLATRAEKQTALDTARADLKSIADGVEARGDKAPNADEVKAHTEARDRATKAQAEITELDEARTEIEQRVDDWEASEAARDAAEKSAERYGGTTPTRVRVGTEEPVYRKDAPHSFFRDLYAYRYEADPVAADRIIRHTRMTQVEARSVGTAQFGEPGGLVIPQFLLDDFAPVARQGRPFADFIGGRDLPPEGMTLHVPRGNTGTVVVSQTTENSAVAEQDVDISDVLVAVRTIAGQQNLSRQALDRGRGTDETVMQDLAEAYTAELDRQVIDGTGANGQHLGVMSTTNVATVTSNTATGVSQLKLVADAVQRIHSDRFMPASVVVVHPRRWAFWVQSTDSNGRPLVTPQAYGPQNVFGVGDLTIANGIVGTIYGLPVLADPNIPTDESNVSGSTGEDVIIVTRHTDLRLWEDDPLPRRVRFEETLAGQLTVKIVAWDYSAFSAARYPTATVVVAGSGLQTPTFS